MKNVQTNTGNWMSRTSTPTLLLIGGATLAVLLSTAGCGVDPSSLLDDLLDPPGAVTDIVGTWTGTLTEAAGAQNYQIVIDSSGAFASNTGVSGTASVSTAGAVTYTYMTQDGLTVSMKGKLNSDKTSIVMSQYTWSGASSGSTALTGTLSKAAASATFQIADLVGSWSGTLKAASLSKAYDLTVDASGKLTLGDGGSGTATISTSGTVIFMFTADGSTVTMEGTMNSARTKIVMSNYSWTGEPGGSTALTGTLVAS